MILGTTGNRVLGSYDIPNPTYNYVRNEIIKQFEILKPEKVITGMALGNDTLIADLCIELRIKFIASVPFIGQEKAWNKEDQKKYHKLLFKAEKVIVVSEGGYAGWKMQIRNQHIVDSSDKMLAIYDNSGFGGTYNCIKYAISKNKEIIYINPNNHG